jgi:hypothetical protein
MRAGLFVVGLLFAAGPALAETQDNLVDVRVRGSAEAAEALQGPFDGGWTLVSQDGTPLYAFELVDKPGGRDPLEGVWRDLTIVSVPGDIGLMAGLERGQGALVIRLGAQSGHEVVIRLKRDAAGSWAGEMSKDGIAAPVRLRRDPN